jgi:hypothetical protein
MRSRVIRPVPAAAFFLQKGLLNLGLSELLQKLFALTLELFLPAAGPAAKYITGAVQQRAFPLRYLVGVYPVFFGNLAYRLVLTECLKGDLCFLFRASALSSHVSLLLSPQPTDLTW